MALQTSGPISLQDIQGEFGGSNPISLSEYYSAASGIPSSGAISLLDFYGASSVTEIVVSTNQADMDLAGYATANGWDGTSALLVTINSGVVVYGSDTSTPALTISGSFPGGVTVVNSGTIVGDGGNGGYGGLSGDGQAGQNGFDGGTALFVDSLVSFNNLNTIAGGGGGGGGGASSDGSGSGGGGGGGRSGLVDSSGGDAGRPRGEDGTFSNFGAGANSSSGDGGDGGPWGASGQNGEDGEKRDGGSGGSGGSAVVGDTSVTWVNTGTRLGAIS